MSESVSGRYECSLESVGQPVWSIRPFYANPKLVTLFMILCESHNVMILMEEFERHRKDVSKMTSHRNSVFADTIVWITISFCTLYHISTLGLSVYSIQIDINETQSEVTRSEHHSTFNQTHNHSMGANMSTHTWTHTKDDDDHHDTSNKTAISEH